MASAPPITALVSEPVGKPDGELTSSEVLQHSPQISAKPSTEDPPLHEINEPKRQENSKSSEQPSASANGTSNGTPVPEAKQGQPNVGVKRDLDVTLTPGGKAEKPNAEQQQPAELEEPNTKKQKTNEDSTTEAAVVANGISSAPAQNGKAIPVSSSTEKNKGGRPRKTKDTVRKDVPTDGIGSRTRSRTKVVS
ncbi:hypothetical protein BJX66DRAFT_331930 [Aspergillus keveii]|uniref:Uncharacterized protein n=1 Tax=Aspergillus keveii TaxID=714993 RepID=A0ABR4GPI9_9EURO